MNAAPRTSAPHTSAQARVRRAEAELAAAQLHLEHSARPWRERVVAHRAESIMLAGFATGMALALLPTRWWGRIGAVFGTVTAAAARSLLTPAVIGAAVTKMRAKTSAASDSDAH